MHTILRNASLERLSIDAMESGSRIFPRIDAPVALISLVLVVAVRASSCLVFLTSLRDPLTALCVLGR